MALFIKNSSLSFETKLGALITRKNIVILVSGEEHYFKMHIYVSRPRLCGVQGIDQVSLSLLFIPNPYFQ